MNVSDFLNLMHTLAAAWNSNDATRATNCFAEDALYIESPNHQHVVGRAAMFEYFGGAAGRNAPMHMTWHHLLFDVEQQTGMGEYIFSMSVTYHGAVVIKVKDGLITHWREYQRTSDLDWEDFITGSMS